MKLTTVIAAWDERDNIEDLARRLDRTLRGLPGVDFETIFVVEGRDGTREILEMLREELGRIRILYSEKPGGLGNAFRKGFAAISPDSDLVVTMDADGNHQPEEIPRLIAERERREADILIGSRFVEGARSEGIPAWKRAASGIVNRVIGSLFDVEVKDKSSGFRVYRAVALRRLTGYRNGDFAFLPEILIHATDSGLRIAEAPIHFRFRTRGVSKMSIPATSASYLALLRTRFDRLSVLALLFLAVGTALRLAYAFPLHRFVPDADSLLTGMRALEILEGKIRIFYSGVRIGALESYMHVPAIWLLGVSRAAVSLAPLFSGVALLLAFFFFVREIFGRTIAVAALVFLALPSPAWIAWTYMPNGYPETMLLCGITLLLGARLVRTGLRGGSVFLFGLAAGAGVWQSVQTLTCTAPVLLWLLACRPDLARRSRFWAIAAAGVAVGAMPWIAYNIVHPLGTFEGNFAVQAAPRSSFAANASYLLRYDLRELLVGVNPFAPVPDTAPPVTRLEGALTLPAAAVYALGFAFLLATAIRRRSGTPAPGASLRRGAGLVLFLAATAILLDVFSAAGQTRGFTVRYVLPLFFVAAIAAGLLVGRLWPRRRWLAGFLATTILAFNLSGYYWPWTPDRKYWRELDHDDRELLGFLQSRHVRWVCGNYWLVYPMNFLSARRITGIPFHAPADLYGYGDLLGDRRPDAWALVVLDRSTLTRWVRGLSLEGRVEEVAGRYFVLLPSDRDRDRWSTRALIGVLQRAAPPFGH